LSPARYTQNSLSPIFVDILDSTCVGYDGMDSNVNTATLRARPRSQQDILYPQAVYPSSMLHVFAFQNIAL